MADIQAKIQLAIAAKRLVRFRYRGGEFRTLEPHALGESTTAKVIVFGWYRTSTEEKNKAQGWRTCLVSEIRDMEVLEETFVGPREGFNPLASLAKVHSSLPLLRVIPHL